MNDNRPLIQTVTSKSLQPLAMAGGILLALLPMAGNAVQIIDNSFNQNAGVTVRANDGRNGFGGSTQEKLWPTELDPLPFSGSISTTTIGGTNTGESSSSMTIAMSDSAFNFGFDAVTAHSNNGRTNLQGYLAFSVDTDTTYTLAGQYESVSMSDGWSYLHVGLAGPSGTLYWTDVQGDFVGSFIHTLGGGALTGNLIAGETYTLSWDWGLRGNGTTSDATGFLNLSFGESPSVPEPSTLALLALGLVGVGVRRRQKP